MRNQIDFEKDLQNLKEKVQDGHFAQALYHTLCNNQFVHKSAPNNWRQIAQEASDKWFRRRDGFPRGIWKFIRWFRGFIIPFAYGKNGREYRKFWAYLNNKLCSLETKIMLHSPFPSFDWLYSCSWRYAGGLVADMRDKGEDYLDFYCSGHEGQVNETVAYWLNKLEWFVDEEEE